MSLLPHRHLGELDALSAPSHRVPRTRSQSMRVLSREQLGS